MLTRQQTERLRLAIANARGHGCVRWADGGVLSQLAMLEGASTATLATWDAVEDEDGPLTARRLIESGNAFQGWPLDLLEALDVHWRGSDDRGELLNIVSQWTDGDPQPEGGNDMAPYSGQERRSAFTVAVDIKSLLFVVTVIAPLLGVTQWIMSVRQDVRSNTLNDIADHATLESLSTRVTNVEKDYQRSKLLFCAARSGEDSARSRDLPDIGC